MSSPQLNSPPVPSVIPLSKRFPLGGVRHEIRQIRMRYLQRDFCTWEEPFSKLYMVKFSLHSKLVSVISTLHGLGKLLEHSILKIPSVLGSPSHITAAFLACVAGVRKRRGRELGRETTRAQIPPSPFNASNAGYSVLGILRYPPGMPKSLVFWSSSPKKFWISRENRKRFRDGFRLILKSFPVP